MSLDDEVRPSRISELRDLGGDVGCLRPRNDPAGRLSPRSGRADRAPPLCARRRRWILPMPARPGQARSRQEL